MFRQTYFQKFKESREKVQTDLLTLLRTHVELMRNKYPHQRGIPNFELATPNNPRLKQSELYSFTGPLPDETIGNDCRGINDNQPFLVKLLIQTDRASDRALGFNRLRSFPYGQIDFKNPESEWVRNAQKRNENLRKRNGRHGSRPIGHDSREDTEPSEPYFPEVGPRVYSGRQALMRELHREFLHSSPSLLDLLALGYTKAGEELRVIEETHGYYDPT
ncbi:MAG: hypothetical protein PHG25_02305 [Candidatus Pacebacteria bacterium]|nr:hypothetical protein [Candidatus Paceibacterota bacterium]